MILIDKCKQIAAGLLKKSRSGELKWSYLINPSSDSPNEFTLRLNHSTIVLRQISPSTEADYLELLIRDHKGNAIGKLLIYEEEPGWSELSDLFYEAQRTSGSLGPILDELDTLIKSN